MSLISVPIARNVAAEIYSFRGKVENYLLNDSSNITDTNYQCIANIFIANTWNYLKDEILENRKYYPNTNLPESSKTFIKEALKLKDKYMPCLLNDNINKRDFLGESKKFIIRLVNNFPNMPLIDQKI